MLVNNSRFLFLIASSSKSIKGVKASNNKDLPPFISDMKVSTDSFVSVLGCNNASHITLE